MYLFTIFSLVSIRNNILLGCSLNLNWPLQLYLFQAVSELLHHIKFITEVACFEIVRCCLSSLQQASKFKATIVI